MKKYILSSLAIIAVFACIFVINTKNANANPSQITETKSANATSTVFYLTAGQATTTLAVDTQGDGGQVADSASLLVQQTASTTGPVGQAGSILAWRYEYANTTIVNGSVVDCTTVPLSCDWYSDSVQNSTVATSTYETGNYAEHLWPFASSTPGGLAQGLTNNRGLKRIVVPTPTRYIRAVFYVPIGASPTAVWSEWVTKREQR